MPTFSLQSVWFVPSLAGVSDRFFERVEKGDGCWLWTGSMIPSGYGQMTVGSISTEFGVRVRQAYAHRLSYAIHKGPIPDGFVVDHLCRNRRCVNPAHLEAVECEVNSERVWIRMSHCRRGHALPKGGSKECAHCAEIARAAALARKKSDTLFSRVARGDVTACPSGHDLGGSVFPRRRFPHACRVCSSELSDAAAARRRADHLKWAKKNPERHRAYGAKHRAANPDYWRKWRESHPGYHEAVEALRRKGEKAPKGFSKQFAVAK